MSNFTHSFVLFSGDDGLPIEFNIQNTVEKEKLLLKNMIEYGGGLCTFSDEAVYILSPGTKVLNVGAEKKLICSRFIFDCVKQNCLLDTDDYRIEMAEMETSDFSEDNSLRLVQNELEEQKISDNMDNSVDIIDPNKTVSPQLLNCPSSNHAFDFHDSESRNVIQLEKETSPPQMSVIPLLSRNPDDVSACETEKNNSNNCVDPNPDSLDLDGSIIDGQNLQVAEVCEIESDINDVPISNVNRVENNFNDSSINAVVVSSSQPNMDALDQFDNMVLNKLNEKPTEQDDDSQSYTVSSSADAQVSSKPSPHNTSAEIFGGSSAAPDSASQTVERQQYIKNLEKEVEEILQKASPKSIQDKITLVKYICIVKKLDPAIVLQTIQNLQNV